MALAYRVQTVHNGVPGSPYLSTFNFLIGAGGDPQEMNDLVQQFWDDCATIMAGPGNATNLPEVQAFDEATGDVVAAFSVSTTGTNYQGANLEWTAKQGILALRTPDFRAGRRVQGRIFIPAVPSGTGEQVPGSGYLSVLNGAGAALVAGASANGTPLSVYSRPIDGAGGRAGACYPVLNATGRSIWGVLRSRR